MKLKATKNIIQKYQIALSRLTEPPDLTASPERRLWAYVLFIAIKDIALYNDKMEKRWLLSNDIHIGSFLFCCDVVDMDPATLRKITMIQYEETLKARQRYKRRCALKNKNKNKNSSKNNNKRPPRRKAEDIPVWERRLTRARQK